MKILISVFASIIIFAIFMRGFVLPDLVKLIAWGFTGIIILIAMIFFKKGK
jgi:hypothetical protein